jgi:hypothetical protein
MAKRGHGHGIRSIMSHNHAHHSRTHLTHAHHTHTHHNPFPKSTGFNQRHHHNGGSRRQAINFDAIAARNIPPMVLNGVYSYSGSQISTISHIDNFYPFCMQLSALTGGQPVFIN